MNSDERLSITNSHQNTEFLNMVVHSVNGTELKQKIQELGDEVTYFGNEVLISIFLRIRGQDAFAIISEDELETLIVCAMKAGAMSVLFPDKAVTLLREAERAFGVRKKHNDSSDVRNKFPDISNN